jgi:hypothetical protein
MNCLDLVLEKLKDENVPPCIGEFEISWKKKSNEIYSIGLENFDCSDGRLAWFQSDAASKHLLRVFENEKNFDWEPITHNPIFGCDCHLLE